MLQPRTSDQKTSKMNNSKTPDKRWRLGCTLVTHTQSSTPLRSSTLLLRSSFSFLSKLLLHLFRLQTNLLISSTRKGFLCLPRIVGSLDVSRLLFLNVHLVLTGYLLVTEETRPKTPIFLSVYSNTHKGYLLDYQTSKICITFLI